jgi:uncharacterized protein (DUF2132 family)
MGETDLERERLAKEIAYQQGRRDSDVDSRLRSHENRLNAINGSIERSAVNAARLEETAGNRFDALEVKLDGLISTNAARDAVEAERVKQIEKANDKQISTKAFWLGVAAIVTAIIAPIIAHGGLG